MMMTRVSIVTARAACSDTVHRTMVDNENELEEVPAAVRALCNVCPLYDLCYTLGMTGNNGHPMEYGIWGGTTAAQRLGYAGKPTCPACKSTFIIVEGRNRVCLDCELDWPTF